jgi:SAM-dependent methyltransferase
MLDRIFPPVRVGGRASGEDYAEWEYAEGKRLLADFGRHFGSLEGSAVLDIGCGLGGKTTAYAEAGARVVGVDIVQAHVTQAYRYSLSRAARAVFAAGDARALPFADGRFDLVVANDSMEHFPDPRAALSELSRVLRPGGRIFLFFTPWRSPLGSHLYDYLRTPWCHLLYADGVLEEMLRIVLGERGMDPDGASRLMREYRTELNRITVRRYRSMVAEHPELETVLERRLPPKYRILAPIARLPWLGEFFTGTEVALLRKR